MPQHRKRRQQGSASIKMRKLAQPRTIRLEDGSSVESDEVFDIFVKVATGRDSDGRRTYITKHKRGFATRKAAEDAIAQVKVDAAKGKVKVARRGGLLAVDYFADYINAMEELKVQRPKVANNNRGHLRRHIAPVLEDALLTELTTPMLQDLVRKLSAKGLTPSSVRGIMSIVSGGTKYAVDMKLVADDPYPGVRLPKRKKLKKRALPDEEVVRILQELDFIESEELQASITKYAEAQQGGDDRKKLSAQRALISLGARASTAIKFMATTGMRRSEALALEWRHISFENRTVNIEQSLTYVPGSVKENRKGKLVLGLPKSDNAEGLRRLGPGTIALLKQVQADQRERLLVLGAPPDETTPVFDDGIGGWRMPDSITKAFARARDRAGVKNFELRNLRDHAGTAMLATGAHHKTVAEQLGHDPKTLLGVYARPDADLQHDAAEAVEKGIGV